MDGGAWKPAVHGVAQSRTRLSDFPSTLHLHALEKDMATHSRVLAWRIPGTGEPGGLLSLGWHRVGQDRSGSAAAPSGTEAGLHYLEGCAPRRLGGAGRYGRRRGRCGAAFSGAGLPASPARLSVVDGEVLSVSGDWGRIGEDSKAGPRTPRCDLAEGGLRRLGRPLAGVVACSCAPRGAMAALLTAGQVVVTLKDVAVTFTREEWGQLDLDQRTLFREVMLETCGLLVSLGHPVPKPELIHLLEHGQKLWTGTRGLSHSTSPGDRPKCQTRESSNSQPVLSEEALLQGSLTLGSSWDSRLGRAGAAQGLLEMWSVPEKPEVDAGKEAHPGKMSLEDDGLGAGNGLHSGAFQKRVSQEDVLHERDAQLPGKGSPIHRLYKCKQCGKAFNRKWYLVRHQRIHTGMKPYECNACGKAFSQSSTLIRHYLIHTGEKPYKCAECGKAFKRRSYLLQHQPVHTGEKPYECSQCRKAFTHRSTFIRHHRTHSGEKPFECKECEKSFSNRAHLIQHYVIHTGEKPYECAECAKAFRCSSELLQHQRVHTGEKPYTCTQCGKAFHRSTYLLQHSVIHTAETPFKCSQCGKAFKRRSHLLQHQRVHT